MQIAWQWWLHYWDQDTWGQESAATNHLDFYIFPRNVSSAFLLAGHGSSQIVNRICLHKTSAVASFEPPTLMVLVGRRVPHFLFDVGPLLSYRGQKSLSLYEALILLKRAFYEMNQCLLKFVCSQSDTRFRLCVKSKCVYVFCRSGRICERCSACSW